MFLDLQSHLYLLIVLHLLEDIFKLMQLEETDDLAVEGITVRRMNIQDLVGHLYSKGRRL